MVARKRQRHAGKVAAAAARRQLARDERAAGVSGRVAAVQVACATPEFQRRFSDLAARRAGGITSMRDVQATAHSVLDAMGVAHRDVFLTFSWDPTARELGIFFRPRQKIGQMVRHALQQPQRAA